MNEQRTDWVYFLNLTAKVPSHFFHLDAFIKPHGLSMIPMGLNDLLSFTNSGDDCHIFIFINSLARKNYFNKRVRKILKYLIKKHGVHIYILSSFDNTSDRYIYGKSGKYHFTRLPVGLNAYATALATAIRKKDEGLNKWPGAKRRVNLYGEKL
ncbi:MAG: hypothetical protein N4A33_13170 [Bacteriovoracaceae bacterium]|jgi:hypothetical protein|nr:hypothetical protein [Bacteriovoracaceae bacterium]